MSRRKNSHSGMVCRNCGHEVMMYFSGWRHLRNQHTLRPSCGLPAEPESLTSYERRVYGYYSTGQTS